MGKITQDTQTDSLSITDIDIALLELKVNDDGMIFVVSHLEGDPKYRSFLTIPQFRRISEKYMAGGYNNAIMSSAVMVKLQPSYWAVQRIDDRWLVFTD